jgi:hypothetical protein
MKISTKGEYGDGHKFEPIPANSGHKIDPKKLPVKDGMVNKSSRVVSD